MALGDREAVLIWRGHGTHGMGGLTSYIVITDKGKVHSVLGLSILFVLSQLYTEYVSKILFL